MRADHKEQNGIIREMKYPIVIAGYAGVGKTSLAKKYQNVFDLESSTYKYQIEHSDNRRAVEVSKGTARPSNLGWPDNYIAELKKQLQTHDIVLVQGKPATLEILDRASISYVICYPEKSSLNLYAKRFVKRGNNQDYVNKVLGEYDSSFEQWSKNPSPKMVLMAGETLEDYLIRNNYHLIKRSKIVT